LKFGKSKEEALAEPAPSGGGGASFMKYCKKGDNQVWILDEPDKWVWYWEHFNPGGFPFPCTNDRDTCPGCTSEVEKMKKASRKIAFNAFDGEYTNVWKVPKTVAEKLETRHERRGTITDRPYMITQLVTQVGNKTNYDYDIEAGSPDDMSMDLTEVEQYKTDPETMLAQAYEDAWGDDAKVRATKAQASQAVAEDDVKSKIARAAVQQQMEADSRPKIQPKQEKTVTEEELRSMEPWDLVELCKKEGFGEVPKEHAETTDSIVDWMLQQ
jgi:hypothetical protein